MKAMIASMILAVVGLSTTAHAGFICKEGQQALFEEAVEGTDRYIRVLRTCKNGSYWEKAARVVPNSRCQEGQVVVFEEQVPGTDHYNRVPRTCTNGRFYPKAANVAPKACKEGSTTILLLQDENDRSYSKTVTCVNGKWK